MMTFYLFSCSFGQSLIAPAKTVNSRLFYTGPYPNQTKKKNVISGKAKVSWAYSDDKKHLPHVIPAAYAVSCRAKPDKAGGWGCNPHTENTRRILIYARGVTYIVHAVTATLKTHDEAYSTPVRNQTKQNKTKRKRKPRQSKTKGLKPRRDSLELYFLFMGLQPLKPCLITLTTNE